MTNQTVSICNIHGGVALDAAEADALAGLLDVFLRRLARRPDDALHLRARERLGQVVRVLRGVKPSGKA